MKRTRGFALILVATLSLAGCSLGTPVADSSTEASAPAEEAVAPATGIVVEGTGYSFFVPEGWDVPEGFEQPGIDVFAADLTDTADGFSDNVNIVLSPAGEVTAEQVETAGVSELEGAGATDVTVADRITVAGAESAHLSAGFASEGVEYNVEQYYLTSDGQTYVVTFSFSPTVSQADRDALARAVLASWSWA